MVRGAYETGGFWDCVCVGALVVVLWLERESVWVGCAGRVGVAGRRVMPSRSEGIPCRRADYSPGLRIFFSKRREESGLRPPGVPDWWPWVPGWLVSSGWPAKWQRIRDRREHSVLRGYGYLSRPQGRRACTPCGVEIAGRRPARPRIRWDWLIEWMAKFFFPSRLNFACLPACLPACNLVIVV